MSATEADLRADSSVPSATPFTKQGGTHHGLAQRRAEHHQQQQQNLQESTSQLSSNDLSHERNIIPPLVDPKIPLPSKELNDTSDPVDSPPATTPHPNRDPKRHQSMIHLLVCRSMLG